MAEQARSDLAEAFRRARETMLATKGAYFLAVYRHLQAGGTPASSITPDMMLAEMNYDRMAGSTDKNELRSFLAYPEAAEAWVRQWGKTAQE
jgi:hypothetical protein